MHSIHNPERIRELDALRGIAALLVLCFHLTLWRTPEPLGFEIGSTGVHLFFIISGFVIFMTVQRTQNARAFVVSRVSRLYPVYWVVVTITFVARLLVDKFQSEDAFREVNFSQYAANLTMFQFYFGKPSIDGQYWTLLVEMLFYLIVVCFLFASRVQLLPYFGVALVFISTMVVNAFWSESAIRVYESVPLLMYFPLFVSGIFFYRIYSGEDVKQNYLLVFFSALCALLHYRSDWYIFISRAQYSLMIFCYHVAFLLFVNGKMQFLVNPVTLFLGKISYSLYLVHNFIFASFLVSLLTEKYNVNLWVACFCIAMPACIAVSALLTFYVERPLTRRMRRMMGKKELKVIS